MTRRFEIRALRDGFRRAGRAWPAAGTIVEDLTPEQITAVEDEPQLVVEELPSVAPEKDGKAETGSDSKAPAQPPAAPGKETPASTSGGTKASTATPRSRKAAGRGKAKAAKS